jgi:hypothetical protein
MEDETILEVDLKPHRSRSHTRSLQEHEASANDNWRIDTDRLLPLKREEAENRRGRRSDVQRFYLKQVKTNRLSLFFFFFFFLFFLLLSF